MPFCLANSSWLTFIWSSIDLSSLRMGSILCSNAPYVIWLSTHTATFSATLLALLILSRSHAALSKKCFCTLLLAVSCKSLGASKAKIFWMNPASRITFRTMSQVGSTLGSSSVRTANIASLTPSGGLDSIRSSSSDFLSMPSTAFLAASKAGSTSAISFWMTPFFSLITTDCSSNFWDNAVLDAFLLSASPCPWTMRVIFSSASLFFAESSFSFTAKPACNSATWTSVSLSFCKPPSMWCFWSKTSCFFSLKKSKKWLMKSKKSRGVTKLYFCAIFFSRSFMSSTLPCIETMVLARISCRSSGVIGFFERMDASAISTPWVKSAATWSKASCGQSPNQSMMHRLKRAGDEFERL
mmetsp:Transcript_98082/g.299849  ORF Transcript_98082/g.299849 Transcript_98082/m.299849 type:complete len:355 (+) Transcript_98082:3762-4826(+)